MRKNILTTSAGSSLGGGMAGEFASLGCNLAVSAS
jgi:NAD(P)-dependent dehydrogenase (short-subunit alcohol dehydrogenase family)